MKNIKIYLKLFSIPIALCTGLILFYISCGNNFEILKQNGGAASALSEDTSGGGAAFPLKWVASNGSYYFSDYTSPHCSIRKVDASGIITNYAGNATNNCGGGPMGNGVSATSGNLSYPDHVALDTSGNLYIAEEYDCTIRKVSTDGIITTVAGIGGITHCGYLGDGGAATSARLQYPAGIVVDVSGVLYISDTGNNVIRKVDLSGVISTYAGTGTFDYTGDGGLATSATLAHPLGIAVDLSSNLYIADGSNFVIRMVPSVSGSYFGQSMTAGRIYTVGGTGSSGYTGDGGIATSAQMKPLDVAVDSSGILYVAEGQNHILRKIDTSGIISTIAGTGTAGHLGDGSAAASAQMNYPAGVAVDSNDNIYIGEQGSSIIRKINTNGIINTIAGIANTTGNTGDGGLATSATLGSVFFDFD